MAEVIPIVDYLALGDGPYLVAQRCLGCGARFFGRRNGCGACGGESFDDEQLPDVGKITTFTIVSKAAPGVVVPFIAGVVDCGGASVRANIINVEPDPEQVRLGMDVKLVTYSLGLDDDGIEAIGFAFEPNLEGSSGQD